MTIFGNLGLCIKVFNIELLLFEEKNSTTNTLVISTHGIVKKSSKVPALKAKIIRTFKIC
jgi:hypothetical protein